MFPTFPQRHVLAMHCAFTYPGKKNTNVRELCIDYIARRYNSTIPAKLFTKLKDLGLNTHLCNWILDFLMSKPQVVRIDDSISTLSWSSVAPQGCVLSPLLYFLFTHN